MILQTLFERYDEAIKSGELALPNVGSVTAQYCRTLLLFYEALARIGQYRKVRAGMKQQFARRIKKNISKIKMWAEHSPENQLHKYHLLRAEWHRIKGETAKTLDHYDLAIQLSRKAGFLQEEALATRARRHGGEQLPRHHRPADPRQRHAAHVQPQHLALPVRRRGA